MSEQQRRALAAMASGRTLCGHWVGHFDVQIADSTKRALIRRGLIMQNGQRRGDGWPTYEITEAGLELLRRTTTQGQPAKEE